MDNELLLKLEISRKLYYVYSVNNKVRENINEKIEAKNTEIANRNANVRHYTPEEHTIIPAGILGGGIVFIWAACGVLVFFSLFLGYYKSDRMFLLSWAVFLSIILLGLCIIGFVIAGIVDRKDSKLCLKRNKEEIKKRDTDVNEMSKELMELQKECAEYDSNTQIAEKAYNNFLSQNFVYKSYQSIIPICQFIQYLESGRCSTLEGPNGCYNLYESEMRQNIIIGHLEMIESKLDNIASNQRVMIDTLQKISEDSNLIVESLGNLESDVSTITTNVQNIQVCEEIQSTTTAYQSGVLRSIDNRLS